MTGSGDERKLSAAVAPPSATGAEVKGSGNALSFLLRSPWTAWVGLRYLRSKKNSRFLSFITLMSILGVGIGVTAMIVVLSVMDGFEFQLEKRLMSTDLHILITPTERIEGYDNGFVSKDALEKAGLADPLKSDSRIESFWPVVSTEAIFRTQRKVTGVVVKGVNEERMTRLKSTLTERADAQLLSVQEGGERIRLPGVFVGQELAYELGLIAGDQVTLISPTETEGPMQAVPRLKRFVIEGIYHSGLPEQELHTVFAADTAVRAFLRRPDAISQWEVTVKDFNGADDVGNILRQKVPGFRVQDWKQLNAHLFASLKLERIAMFVILAFIIIVASFNIVTSLTLMVIEKRKEISILKAMGARHGEVGAIFLAEGILIGGYGVVGGTLFGFLLCLALRRYEFIKLPDIYYDSSLPVTFNGAYYAGVALCAFIIVVAACLYPSKRAAQLNLLDGIRYG